MQIIKHLSKAGRYDINIISWEKTDWKQGLGVLIYDVPVVDIREFRDGQPGTGICLTDDMVVAMLLHTVKKKEDHTKEPIISGTFGEKDFFIYEKIGTICRKSNKSLLLTKSSFKVSDQVQYDLRYWNEDITRFTHGISLSEEEYVEVCLQLCSYVDGESIFIPQMKLKGEAHTYDDLINELLLMLDRAYLIGQPAQLEAIKSEICKIICAN
ncbi:hypothetical protein AALA24_13640 [Anaerovoracaceae bacterium 42-11]